MQFKVPQNIDMQDRIIGPLTLSQFFYLLFGGLLIYILFNKLVLNGLTFFFVILAIPIGVFTFAMAFIKIQDRPFPSFFAAAVGFFSRPRERVWAHYVPPVTAKTPPKKVAEVRSAKTLDTVQVGEIASILDRSNPPKEPDGQ